MNQKINVKFIIKLIIINSEKKFLFNNNNKINIDIILYIFHKYK